MDLKKILLTVLIASLSFSGIVGILIFLFSKFGTLEARVLLTTISIGGFSMAGLCSSLLFEKQKCVPFAITGMSIDFIGFLVVLAYIWGVSSETWIRTALSLIVVCFALAHSSLLLLIAPKSSLVMTSLITTLVFISIVALMILALILNISFGGTYAFRLMGVAAILDVLGTVLTPILNKL